MGIQRVLADPDVVCGHPLCISTTGSPVVSVVSLQTRSGASRIISFFQAREEHQGLVFPWSNLFRVVESIGSCMATTVPRLRRESFIPDGSNHVVSAAGLRSLVC